MVKLENNNISLVIDVGYCYSDVTDTDEFYYYLSLLCNDEPIILIPEHLFSNTFSNRNSGVIDFELNDAKLSDVFLSALNSRTKAEVTYTFEGAFDLSVEPYAYPENKCDEWVIKVGIGSLFYGSPKKLAVNFDFYCSYDDLLRFTNELMQLENTLFNEYVEKYGRERYR